MNINQLMQQAQKMQRDVQKKLDEFDLKEFEIDYKNGSIIIHITGGGKIVSLDVNKALIDPDDKITMEEMIIEAINEAYDSVKADRDAIQQASMPKGGIPGMGM